MITEKTLLDEITYELRRQQIEDQAGAMQERVDAYRDQKLSLLFVQSGWTQERIAEKEGKSVRWVYYRLQFGRFLIFCTSCANSQKPAKNLTEGRFRTYFEQTDKGKKEQLRFRDAASAMEEDLLLPTKKRDMELAKRIVEKFADAKWHYIETICESVEGDRIAVESRLRFMKERGMHGCTCERRKAGKSKQYRIYKGGSKKIQVEALIKELEPHLSVLEREGRRKHALMSQAAVLDAAHRIRQLLERMAQK